MNAAIYPIMSGSIAQERRLEAIMTNVANLETGGFRSTRATFTVAPFAATTPGPVPFDHLRFRTAGVTLDAEPDLSPGRIRRTENPFDLAVDGDGYFVVETAQGRRYTRAGHVALDRNRVLITNDGFPLLGTKGRITLPPGQLLVLTDGTVGVTPPGGDKHTLLSTLELVSLDPTAGVTRVGTTLFEGTPTGGRASGEIRQGFREDSNVNPFQEIQAMIDAARSYQAAQKLMTTLDESTGRAISDIGST